MLSSEGFCWPLGGVSALVRHGGHFAPEQVCKNTKMLFVLMFIFCFVFHSANSSVAVSGDHVAVTAIARGRFGSCIHIVKRMLPDHVVCLSTVRNKEIRRHLRRRKTVMGGKSIVLHLDGPLLGVNVVRDRTSLTCRRGRLHGAHVDVRRRQLDLGRSHVNVRGRFVVGGHHCKRCGQLVRKRLVTERSCLRTARRCRTMGRRLSMLSRQVHRSDLFHLARVDDLSRGVVGVGQDLTLMQRHLRGLGIGTPVSKRINGLRTRVKRSVSTKRRVNRVVATSLGMRTLVSRRCIRHIIRRLPTSFAHSKRGCGLRMAGICPRIGSKRFHASFHFAAKHPRGVQTKRACRVGLRLKSPIGTILVPQKNFFRVAKKQ